MLLHSKSSSRFWLSSNPNAHHHRGLSLRSGLPGTIHMKVQSGKKSFCSPPLLLGALFPPCSNGSSWVSLSPNCGFNTRGGISLTQGSPAIVQVKNCSVEYSFCSLPLSLTTPLQPYSSTELCLSPNLSPKLRLGLGFLLGLLSISYSTQYHLKGLYENQRKLCVTTVIAS